MARRGRFPQRYVHKVLECPECGYRSTIWRSGGRNRAAGHRKWLYCPGCRQVTNHIEVVVDGGFPRVRSFAQEGLLGVKD